MDTDLIKCEENISIIILFILWISGIFVCLTNNKLVLEWSFLTIFISCFFCIRIYLFIKTQFYENENIENENNIIIDIENPSHNTNFKSVVIYSKNISNENIVECPICLEKIKENGYTISNCDKHYYHKECIDQYISKGFTNCSICRK